MRALALLLALVAGPALAALPTATFDNTGARMLGTQCTVPTGTPQVPATYSDADITTALTAAAAAVDKIVRIDQDFTPSSRISIPAGVTLYSLNGSTINSTSTSRGVRLTSTSRITGMRLTGTRPLDMTGTTAITGWIVNCNDFFTASTGVYDQSTSDNTLHTLGLVQWNRFTNVNYGVWMTRTTTSQFVDNYFSESTSRNFEFHGGKGNLIARNRIDSGITAIDFLADGQYAKYAADIYDNQIVDNWISGISEEGIAFDINGDTGTNTGIVDQFRVTSTANTYNSSPRVHVLRTANFDGNACSGYALTFVTGTNAGKWFRISGCAVVDGTHIYIQISTTATGPFVLITSAEFSAITAGDGTTTGDVVTVGYHASGNLIARNYITDSYSPIAFWGMGIGNIVTSNIIERTTGIYSIGLRSLCGMTASTSQSSTNNTTTPVLCGIVDRNIVTNNTADGLIRVGGKTYASEANTLGYVSASPIVQSNQLRNNVGTIVNFGWTDITNTTEHGGALNDAALLTNNQAPGVTFVGGASPTAPDGYRLPSASALVGGGFPIRPTHDFRGCRFDPAAPSIGAFEVCVGDPRE